MGLKTKRASEVATAFEDHVIRSFPYKIERILSDAGTEYQGQFAQLLQRYGIKHTTTVLRHAYHAERLIRSLKSFLARAMKHHETSVHLELMKQVVKTYNRRRHRIIRCSPLAALRPENAAAVLHAQTEEWSKVTGLWEDRTKKQKEKLKEGDLCRLKRNKSTFTRVWHQKFSDEIFVVSKVLTHLPIPMVRLKRQSGEELP